MPCYLHGLPEAVLDELVNFTFDLSPSLRLTFLASLGTHLHGSAVRVLYKTLEIPDDQSAIDHCSQAATRTTMTNPERYAATVKTVIVRDSDKLNGHGLTLKAIDNGTQHTQHDAVVPLDANTIYALLDVCLNMDGLVWESTFPPPEGLCEILMSKNLRLSRLSCAPRNQSTLPRGNVAKWNALSLPLLMYLPITTLHLSGLSQSGARALSSLLSSLGQGSTLEELDLNFVWLDDSLCASIAAAGWKLRKLSMSSSGTKLSDKGLVLILEECEALEVLALVEIQGRLSRHLWGKPQHYPPSLRHLRIVISEVGPHHSWTTDHLNSLYAIPLEKLKSLSVVRHEAHPRLVNGVLHYEADDVLSLDSAPTNFVEKMRDGRSLTTFECDFWTWSVPDIKVVLNSCPNLQTMKISLDFAFSKLPSLSSMFVSLPDLRRLSVCVNHPHAPGTPPRLLHPCTMNSTRSHAEVPVYEQMQTQTRTPKSINDPSMPLLRDIKRFVRKIPRIIQLDWYGKAGRGSWVVARRTTSKFGANISIEYKEPSVTHDVWEAIIKKHGQDGKLSHSHPREKMERVGHLWAGEAAEALAKEVERHDFSTSPAECPRKLKELTGRGTKMELPSASSSNDLSSPSLSLSPVSSSPLTPLHSERSFAKYITIASNSDSHFSDVPTNKQTGNPKRYPPEPAPNSKMTGSFKGRARNTTTASSWKGTHSECRKSLTQSTRTTILNANGKNARRKGGGPGATHGHPSVLNDGAPLVGSRQGCTSSNPASGKKLSTSAT